MDIYAWFISYFYLLFIVQFKIMYHCLGYICWIEFLECAIFCFDNWTQGNAKNEYETWIKFRSHKIDVNIEIWAVVQMALTSGSHMLKFLVFVYNNLLIRFHMVLSIEKGSSYAAPAEKRYRWILEIYMYRILFEK